MSRDLPGQLVDRSELARIVGQSLGREAIEVDDWDLRRIHGGVGEGGTGVYRLAGTARGPGGEHPWSLVLKVLRAPDTGAPFVSKPSEGWDREVRTYRSGLLDDLPPGLAAPRCHAITEPAGFVCLWLEDVADEAAPRWPIRRFVQAARHLGRFNGRSLARRPVPPDPWLQRNLLRWRAEASAGFWAEFERAPSASPARRLWPDDLLDRNLRLWKERAGFLDLLDRLPQVLVHGDADRRNLLSRPGPDGDETVAIDWAFTGVAALGEELVNLVVASALWFQADPMDLPELAECCLDGYVAGLRDVGWSRESRLAQLGFAVAAALRYGPFIGAATARVDFLRKIADVSGHSVDEFVANATVVVRFALEQRSSSHAT
jgi:hypothetical protein